MDKSTLSGYGWVIIVTLVLAVMLAFATPFGKYVGQGVSSVAKGFVGAGQNAMSEDNRDALENEWNEFFNTNANDTNIIPQGGTYYIGINLSGEEQMCVGDYTGATQILTAGDEFPSETKFGDVYVYGDYEYRYGRGYCCCDSWYCCSEADGWGVCVIDRSKTQYETALSYINGEPVTTMTDAYYECRNLEVAPIVPKTVVDAIDILDTPVVLDVIKLPCTIYNHMTTLGYESINDYVCNHDVEVEYYHFNGCGH